MGKIDLEKLPEQGKLLKSVEWNTLIILDACRYDVFAKVIPSINLPGRLTQIKVHSIDTTEWYGTYWKGEGEKTDPILISANPQAVRFGNVIPPKTKFSRVILAYDKRFTTDIIRPSRTLEYFFENVCDAKAVIHMIPPHQPFIGEKGLKFYEILGVDVTRSIYVPVIPPAFDELIKDYVMKHNNNWDEIKEYYTESLIEVLNLIAGVILQFYPPVIITSDHGEVIGEEGAFGHGFRHPKLEAIQKTVPWFVVDTENLSLQKRLAGLGYK